MVFFHSHAFNTYTQSLSQVLLKAEDVNCINVDWINGSLEYIPAVNNLRVAGAEVAYFIDVLMVRRVIILKVYLFAFASPRIRGTFPFLSLACTSTEHVKWQALLYSLGKRPWLHKAPRGGSVPSQAPHQRLPDLPLAQGHYLDLPVGPSLFVFITL